MVIVTTEIFPYDLVNIILKGLSFNFYIMKKLPLEIDTLAIVSINLPESW